MTCIKPQIGSCFPPALEKRQYKRSLLPVSEVFLRLESARIPAVIASLPCRGWRVARSARPRAALVRGFSTRQFPAPFCRVSLHLF